MQKVTDIIDRLEAANPNDFGHCKALTVEALRALVEQEQPAAEETDCPEPVRTIPGSHPEQ